MDVLKAVIRCRTQSELKKVVGEGDKILTPKASESCFHLYVNPQIRQGGVSGHVGLDAGMEMFTMDPPMWFLYSNDKGEQVMMNYTGGPKESRCANLQPYASHFHGTPPAPGFYGLSP